MMIHVELDIPRIRQLYDDRRFLDAFNLTGDVWKQPEVIEQYDAETLVLGARLAAKMGNNKVERALYRYILNRFPDEPITRVYARGSESLHTSVFDYLKDFERQPGLGTDDPRLNVYWLCQNAYLWALVRDFDRSEILLAQAETFAYDTPWLMTSKAYVALFQDEWEQALTFTEQAWQLEGDLKGVFTASVLAQCLTKLGRLEEVVARLDAIADGNQCYQLTATVLWYLLALAERSNGDQQASLLQRCHVLLDRLPTLTPLADRVIKEHFAAIRLDIALIERNIEEMQASAAAVNNLYFQSIRDHLQQHPQGSVYMGAFQLVWQKHNTCLPASMATVIPATPPLDADELADTLTYGGTMSWVALDWLREHGFAAKPFIFTVEIGKALLQKGISFIYMTEGDDWGHAMAAIGYDDATGTLILHDPSQPRHLRVIMEKIEEYYGPFSPEALAVVPLDRAADLECIPEDASRPLAEYIKFWATYHEKGWSAMQPILDDLRRDFPEHPISKRLHAIYFANTGRLAEALTIQEALLAQYPESVQCRRDLLMTLKQTRDTARLLQVYEDFVEGNYLPGLSQEKSYPAGIHLVEYADGLNFTASGRPKALKYLQQVLYREPTNAAAYHSLGDVLRSQGQHQESLLPFSIASFLKPEDDHYAHSVCEAWIQCGHLERGFAHLHNRIELWGDSPHAFGVWLSYISALEEYGYPDQAIELFAQAEQQFADTPEVLLFGVHFWLRMGRKENARQLLDSLEQKGHILYFLEAATNFYYRQGEWEKALSYSAQWNVVKPGDISAFRFYSFLFAFKHGRLEKKKLVQQAVQQFKNDEAFEEFYCETLDELFLDAEKIALLRERVSRNPRDGWAWNELCHEMLSKAELADEAARPALLQNVEEVFQHCRTLGAGSFELSILSARQKLCVGDRHEAIAWLFEALEQNPAHPFPYTKIMDEAGMLPEDEQNALLQRLETKLFCTVSFLDHAVEFAGKIAAQKGLAEAVKHVTAWRQQRPDDPELALSLVRLWLDYGQSRSDAEQAVNLLEPLAQRFPNHEELRLALADAYALLQREADQILAYRKILESDPLQSHARLQLSRVLEVSGQVADADHLLAEGCRIIPIDGNRWFSYATFLERQNKHDKAIETLRQAVTLLPEDIRLRENLINRLLNYNMPVEARRHAQELCDLFPDGAYCWYLLADTLHRSPDYSDLKEIETLYRKALALNSSLLDAAEGLTQLMVSQHRYQDAHSVIDAVPDTSKETPDVQVLSAWILRREGKNEPAYQSIETLLARYPNYIRAWQLLMGWLEEDENWDKTKLLLATIPPVLHSQLDFRVRRLELLQKAGLTAAELDAEWEELCREFPENSRLQMSRFDLLVEAEHWDQAERLLSEYERFDPNSSYLLARKVQFLAHQQKYAEALSVAVKIWTLPGDEEIWPEQFSWEVLEKAGQQKASAQAAIDALLAGKRLRLRLFERLLKYLPLVRNTLYFPWGQRIKQALRLTRGVEYLALMEHLHTVEWEPSRHLALILDYIDELKAYKPAIRHCLKHQERYKQMTPVLQNAVMLMKRVPGNRYAPVIKAWMQNWREIPGIQMWAVANYLLAVASTDAFGNPPDTLNEQFVVSRDCLHTLAYDHTARYMGSMYCEAALRLGKMAEFAEGIERYRMVFQDDHTEYWMPKNRKFLHNIVMALHDLSQTEEAKQAWQIGQQLAGWVQRPWSWVAPTWWRMSRGKLALSRRIWVWLRVCVGTIV